MDELAEIQLKTKIKKILDSNIVGKYLVGGIEQPVMVKNWKYNMIDSIYELIRKENIKNQ